MRLLWFTNIPMPDACRYLRWPVPAAGPWMGALLEQLKGQSDLQLSVVTMAGFRDFQFEADGIEYFIVKRSWQRAVQGRLGSTGATLPVKSQIARYASIVKQWNPDVVHIHGAEADYGLIKAWQLTNKPVVLSIQGLMAPCARKAYGDLLPAELHGSVRSATGIKAKCLHRWKMFRARVPREEEILRSVDMVLGRTQWDHAWAWAFDSGVRYRHVDELMRPEFLNSEPWNLAHCQRYHVFCTSFGEPLKGLHVLVEAVRILRRVYPEIKLTVAGNGFVPGTTSDYSKFVFRQIREWGLQQTVTFLGWTDARGLADQARRAHCFVTPSFIENGCNALQEAMLIGMPIVASMTGGLLTTVDSERTGLMFPTGDAAFLASQINRLFTDDDLAITLGAGARLVARKRHDPGRVTAQVMQAYEELTATAVAPHPDDYHDQAYRGR